VRFKVEAWDELDRICEGIHERCVIDPERFAARLARKTAAAGTGMDA
jgi:fluoroacetyl-CoA thioesterase